MKKSEWECIDLECPHFDGDECTIGDCLDPPGDSDEVCTDG